jgi:hypothetical protein
MDFEIEDEPSDFLASKWSKGKSKGGGGYFGAVGGFGGGKKNEDIYDYDFDGGGMGDFEISHYSSPPEKSTKSSAVKSQPQHQPKAKPTPATASTTTGSQMSAMEKAQSMLNKYSGKGASSATTAKKPISGNKNHFSSSEYNEDDISIGSDELSASGGFMESPMPPKSSKPQLTKESVKAKSNETIKQQLSRGFDLEDDDDADELVITHPPPSALSVCHLFLPCRARVVAKVRGEI